MDQYLDGLGEYKVTVSPVDTHTWGPAKPSKLQQSLIQDSMVFDVQQMRLIREARQELERHGAALGIGADPGSPTVQTPQSAPEAVCTDEEANVTMGLVAGPSGLLYRNGEWNGKPSYSGIGNVVQHSGDLWYYSVANGGAELAIANPGNEAYPWLATWPVGTTATKQCPACTDMVSRVLMSGWVYGDRILTQLQPPYNPYGTGFTYVYGDEVVSNNGAAWLYTSSTEGLIAITYSPVAWPWLATWPEPFTASKVCP